MVSARWCAFVSNPQPPPVPRRRRQIGEKFTGTSPRTGLLTEARNNDKRCPFSVDYRNFPHAQPARHD